MLRILGPLAVYNTTFLAQIFTALLAKVQSLGPWAVSTIGGGLSWGRCIVFL